jgi:hypothetical protein
MTVSVASDQLNTNNSMAWSQSVTCGDFGWVPPLPASTFTDDVRGFGAGGIYSYKLTPPSSASLSGVKMSVSTDTSVPGGQLYGVVMDGSGAILAQTNTLTMTSAMLGTFVQYNFSPPFAMTAGTDYYIGVAQMPNASNVTYYPFCSVTPNYTVSNFYISPLAANSLQNVDRGYKGIWAVLGFSNTAINPIVATKTVVCKKDGPNTVTLTASGGGLTSYTWTPGNMTGSVVAVTPTVSGASGALNYNVTGTDGSSGCKSNAVAITISVSACTGLASINSDGYDLKVFPNPAVSGKSTISGLVGTNSITVFNTLGQVVLIKHVSDESTTIDLSNQPSGNYLVKITNDNNESRSIKIINQN